MKRVFALAAVMVLASAATAFAASPEAAHAILQMAADCGMPCCPC